MTVPFPGHQEERGAIIRKNDEIGGSDGERVTINPTPQVKSLE